MDKINDISLIVKKPIGLQRVSQRGTPLGTKHLKETNIKPPIGHGYLYK